jgi:GDP/UDP-N,N'-diacetylbacillosamine 2-epimerase (hydrolysing)
VIKKICVVTGTRADYGLLRWVMRGIEAAVELELQVLATGMHLSPEFGLTYSEIEQDGFRIDKRVEMLLSSDTPSGIGKSMGVGMIGFVDALHDLAPDLVLVLGDRFEIFAAVAATMTMRVPVAHLHGGEASEGLIDESIRHCITKMSHLHFVAAAEYSQRVIQLGEQPDRVFLVGGLGVDAIQHVPLLNRAELENGLRMQFRERNLLVTFHPVTLENASAEAQVSELLAALEERQDTSLIFTMPNADTEGRILFDIIQRFVDARQNAYAFTSLGQRRYLSTLAQVDGVVGNSSSGLTEAPSFHKGTINIGDRQRGRLKADSVIDCEPTRAGITSAIDRLYSSEFQAQLAEVESPYGNGGASERIVDVLRTVDLTGLVKKRFYDLPEQ